MVVVSEAVQILSKIGDLLRSRTTEVDVYQASLKELGLLVERSAQDEMCRKELALSKEIWMDLKTTFQNVESINLDFIGDEEVAFWYLRTVRGLMLLSRNLSASNQEIPQDLQLQDITIRVFLRLMELKFTHEGTSTPLYFITVSFLHNITKSAMAFDDTEMDRLMAFLQYPINKLNLTEDFIFCYASFFSNLTTNNDFLYRFFRHPSCGKVLHEFLILEAIQHHTEIINVLDKRKITDDDYNITPLDAVMLRIFTRFAVNESFANFLGNVKEPSTEMFLQLIKLLQLVVTSSEKWNKFELTNIMVWCFPILAKSAKETAAYFEYKTKDEYAADVLYEKLSITLDITSNLAQYEQVRKYLLSYNGLEELVSLLRVLQNNLIRINFYKNPDGTVKEIRATNSKGDRIKDEHLLQQRIDCTSHRIMATNFPECKLLIIEILAMLVYKNREVQDKIRELKGLELVLSNCVIDDNDPFIKERSVVCIKYLLENNKPNQDFVAQLEAKKVVQDDALSEAGYEIKIDNSGELKLKSKDNEESL